MRLVIYVDGVQKHMTYP